MTRPLFPASEIVLVPPCLPFNGHQAKTAGIRSSSIKVKDNSEPNTKIKLRSHTYSPVLAMHTVHENALRQNFKLNQSFCKSTPTPKLPGAFAATQISTQL
jgi:hypothetical protein